jgi:hypothetical protein
MARLPDSQYEPGTKPLGGYYMTHKFFEPSPFDKLIMSKQVKTHPVSEDFNPHTQNIWVGGTIVNVDDSTYVVHPYSKDDMCWPETGEKIDQLIIDVQPDDGGPVIRFFFRHDNMYGADGRKREGTRYNALLDALERADMAGQLPRKGDRLFMRWTHMCPEHIRELTRTVRRKMWEITYERTE